jgi:hypothetical protein
MSNFMQRQITGLQNWLRVETAHGTEFVDSASLCLFVRNSDCPSQPLTKDETFNTVTKIQSYTDGEPQSWANIKGYGARLSAPGYLDCTEWTVFDTKEDAEKYLEENYSEDEQD